MRTTLHFGVVVAAALAVFLTGCDTTKTAKGPSDQDLINQTINNWKAGMETKNLAKLETAISDKFNHSEWGDKKQMLSVLDNFFKNGDLDNAKIDATKAKTTLEGTTATVYPVELTAAFGTATIEFKLAKEADGMWRATSVNVSNV